LAQNPRRTDILFCSDRFNFGLTQLEAIWILATFSSPPRFCPPSELSSPVAGLEAQLIQLEGFLWLRVAVSVVAGIADPGSRGG